MGESAADDVRQRVLDQATEVGFDLVGIAPLAPPPDADRFDAWIDRGDHGSMEYLARGRAATTNPPGQWPRGRSLLIVGMGHSRPAVQLEGGGRVARYAAGRDYHNLLGKRLDKLRRRFVREGTIEVGSTFVDATPLLERSHAQVAGLGFASKAANLLHPKFGPWFFLGEIILDIALPPTGEQQPHGSCGTCTACIDACPTDAIVAPGQVDARRCISYATIEHKGLVAHDVREQTGEWFFGCDVCSEVCPWGSKAPDLSERFGLRPELQVRETAETTHDAARLIELLHAPAEPHAERFQGSPLRRPGRDGLARNAAVALASFASDAARDALLRALEEDGSPVVRGAAAWSLAYRYRADHGVEEALDRAAEREPDGAIAEDMRTSRLRGTADDRPA